MTVNLTKTLNSLVPSDSDRNIKKDSLAYRRRAERAERLVEKLQGLLNDALNRNMVLNAETQILQERIEIYKTGAIADSNYIQQLQNENDALHSANVALNNQVEDLDAEVKALKANLDEVEGEAEAQGGELLNYMNSLDQEQDKSAALEAENEVLKARLAGAEKENLVLADTVEGLKLVNASLADQYKLLELDSTEAYNQLRKELEDERSSGVNMVYDLLSAGSSTDSTIGNLTKAFYQTARKLITPNEF